MSPPQSIKERVYTKLLVPFQHLWRWTQCWDYSNASLWVMLVCIHHCPAMRRNNVLQIVGKLCHEGFLSSSDPLYLPDWIFKWQSHVESVIQSLSPSDPVFARYLQEWPLIISTLLPPNMRECVVPALMTQPITVQDGKFSLTVIVYACSSTSFSSMSSDFGISFPCSRP